MTGNVLLAVLGVLVLALGGLALWVSGSTQRAAAMTRSRLARGERPRRRWRGAVEDWLRATRLGRRLETRLHASGLDWKLADLLVIQGGGVLVGLLFGVVLGAPAFGFVVVALAIAIPMAHLNRQSSQRRERFLGQLPDLARAMSAGSAAGLSLRSALEMAASDLSEPAVTELQRVTAALRLGQPLEDALADLHARMPSREVAVLVATLVVQHRSGGDLVEALRNMAFTLDQRKDVRREIRTLLSGVVATAYAVAGMGALSVVMVVVAAPETFPSMLSSWTGRLVLVVCATLYAAGFALIARLTRVET